MGIPASALYDVASVVLDAVVAHYLDEGESLPARRAVSDGRPAVDCEQVMVWVDRVFHVPDADQVLCLHRRVATVCVRLVRCTPNKVDTVAGKPTFPSVDAIDTGAQAQLADAVLVENGVLQGKRDGLFGENLVTFEDWTSLLRDGGFAGGEHRFTVTLDHPLPLGS